MPNDVLAFIACIIIVLGLFLSRALMSIGMMMLFGNAIINQKFIPKLKSFFTQPHLILLTVYFFLLLISFAWSEDISYFKERIQIMLPFLILPFAFHTMNKLDLRWYDWLFVLFIVLLLSGISWSLWQYFMRKEMYDAGYSFSQVIPTPFKNDHIRFSLAVVLGIFLSVDLWLRHHNTISRILLTIFILYAVIYLHILSVKTGIFVFYINSFLFLLKIIFQKKYRKAGTFYLVVLIALPFIMYLVSPSFRNKISYVQYSIDQIKNDSKEPNISDEGRIISYKYALECIAKYPLYGVGLGDVFNQMKIYYKRDFQNKEIIVLLPHNQFLMTGMALGIFGIVYLLWIQIALFRLSFKHDFLYFSFWFMMFLTMLIEPLYETQYGTCMFLFFLLLLLQRRTKTE